MISPRRPLMPQLPLDRLFGSSEIPNRVGPHSAMISMVNSPHSAALSAL